MSNLSKHVLDNFLTPGLAVWGEPASPDPERFLQEYSDVLKGFSAPALDAGYKTLRQTHKGPARWPKIPECVDACDAAHERQKASRAVPSIQADWDRKATNAEALMMNSELGQQAARDGWANGCREFVMAFGRLPQTHEIGRLIGNAAFIDQCAAGDIDMGFFHATLRDALLPVMIRRREQIASRVIHGIVRDGK